MPSPFPGMDPYLENPELWPEVHSRLVVAIADHLTDQLSENYRVAIEKRIYVSSGEDSLLVGLPDVSVVRKQADETSAVATATLRPPAPTLITLPMAEEVQERYLEIRDMATGTVITTIELLSPKNRAGGGRHAYERKRNQVLASLTHLVEIDCLRGGRSLSGMAEVAADYRILVSRSTMRPSAQLYAFNLRQSIPQFWIPLISGEAEPVLDLQSILGQVYQRGRYHLVVDYSQPAKPPLSEADAAWAAALLATAEKRSTC